MASASRQSARHFSDSDNRPYGRPPTVIFMSPSITGSFQPASFDVIASRSANGRRASARISAGMPVGARCSATLSQACTLAWCWAAALVLLSASAALRSAWRTASSLVCASFRLARNSSTLDFASSSAPSLGAAAASASRCASCSFAASAAAMSRSPLDTMLVSSESAFSYSGSFTAASSLPCMSPCGTRRPCAKISEAPHSGQAKAVDPTRIPCAARFVSSTFCSHSWRSVLFMSSFRWMRPIFSAFSRRLSISALRAFTLLASDCSAPSCWFAASSWLSISATSSAFSAASALSAATSPPSAFQLAPFLSP